MTLFQEVGYLFVRGLKQSLRPLPALIPSLFLPAFFLIVFSSAFTQLKNLPGFTAENYLVFYAPVAILQSIFFSSGDAGIDLVVDITSGYFDKLMIAPIRHISILLGKLLAVGLRAAVQSSIVIVIILLMGGKIVTGFPGYLTILALGAFFGMAWSGIGMTIAMMTKNQRATQSAFILFFPFTFITTAQLPLHLLTGWYKVAVQINPVTYILEAFRALSNTGWDSMVIGKGFLAAAGVAICTLTSALLAFRRVTR
jgi:ABC-2 type transport system permease protein